MTKTERVLAYLEGTLPESEKAGFENELAADPELRSELNFQNEVIEGIREARKADLKAMLNNVPVGGSQWGSHVAQGALGVVAVGMIGLGTWFFWPTEETALPEVEPREIIAEQPDILPDQNSPEDENMKSPTAETGREPVTAQNRESVISEETVTPEDGEETSGQPDIHTPDPLAEINDAPDQELAVPESSSTSGVITSESLSGVAIDDDNSRYNFHYQFREGSLILYGDFAGKYEILDLQNREERMMYLYYEGKYYLLDSTASGVQDLKSITDDKITRQLEELRSGK